MFFREAIKAVPGLLDVNMLNCSLYDTANGGDVPECYQYHTVPGQYQGGEYLTKVLCRDTLAPLPCVVRWRGQLPEYYFIF